MVGPCSIRRHCAEEACSGNKVSVQVDTQYPFSDTLTTTITAIAPFTYYVRIPGWIKLGAATYSVNGGPAIPATPEKGLQAIQVTAGTTKFVLNLPAEITTGPFLHSYCRAHVTSWQRRVSPEWLHCCPPWSFALCFRYPPTNQSTLHKPEAEFSKGLPVRCCTSLAIRHQSRCIYDEV